MTEQVKISYPSPSEIDESKKRLCEIRFECLVKMFDVGYYQERGFLNIPVGKPHPQMFKLETRLTLEAIKHCDEYQLGKIIKDAYRQLESHISQYENR